MKTSGLTPAAHSSPNETASDILKEAKRQLEAKGNPSALLDARLLLQQAAGFSHEALIAEPERKIPSAAAKVFRDFIARRLAGEPVSRIIGEKEFYGRLFKVTSATLDPRPDTETLIEAALGFLAKEDACRVIDLGTGTGAIGVTLLAERPKAHAVMSDISAAALEVARENARRHGVEARSCFIHGSWFAGLDRRFDLILSNPPYIPRPILPSLASEVRNFDPNVALDGGPDGLEAYRTIAREALTHLPPEGHVIVEIGEGQALEIEAIFDTQGFVSKARFNDLSGHVRCLAFTPAAARQKRGWK